MKHVLRYLKRTSDFKMKICLKLNAFKDSDFSACEDTRQSTYGFGKWKSKLQNSVVLSTFKAEYFALSECTRDFLSLLIFSM